MAVLPQQHAITDALGDLRDGPHILASLLA